MIHYLSKYKSPRLFAGCYCEINLFESKNFNNKTIGQLVGKSGERKEEFFNLTGVKPHIEYSDDKPTLMLSKYNSREVKLAGLLGERFQTTKSWSSTSINKHFQQLQERLVKDEREIGKKILEEYWPEKVEEELSEMIGKMSNERYSPTQTLLDHSIEIVQESKKIAEAFSLDSLKLQRMALFHDIGKVIFPYYKHTSEKVIEYLPSLREESEIIESITLHHNSLSSFDSTYLALISLINRVISQSHFIPLESIKNNPENIRDEIQRIVQEKVKEGKISNFYIFSSLCYFWIILKCSKELQETLNTELNSLIQNYLSSIANQEWKLNISILWLPDQERGKKISFTRLKISDSNQYLETETI